MGSIIITVPDILDSELIYGEAETRQILRFFWPQQSDAIEAMPITNDARQFAQGLLVAAVDASYAMGFIAALAKTVVRPGSGIRVLVRKLAKRFVRHWWKHATRDDLLDARIYESVRRDLAWYFKSHFLLRSGAAGARLQQLPPVHLLTSDVPAWAWG